MLLLFQEAPPSHDILVFMTGQEEIEALARTCRDISKHLPESCGPMTVVPLYASLPPVQQMRVFLPAPKVPAAPETITHGTLNPGFLSPCCLCLTGIQEGDSVHKHRRNLHHHLRHQIRDRHGDGESQALQSRSDSQPCL